MLSKTGAALFRVQGMCKFVLILTWRKFAKYNLIELLCLTLCSMSKADEGIELRHYIYVYSRLALPSFELSK